MQTSTENTPPPGQLLQEKWADFQDPLQAMFEEGKKQFLEGHFKAAFSWFDKVLTAKYSALRMHNRLAIFPAPALEDDALEHNIFHTAMNEVILCPLPTSGIEDWRLEAQKMYKTALDYCAENNSEQALLWYEEAARRGHSSAQYEAGKCYLLGTGVEQDVWKGIAYLLSAAIAQNTKAYNFLSVCYQDGLLIKKNEQDNILLEKNEEKACQYLHATFFYGYLPENQYSAPNHVRCALLGHTALTKKHLPEIAKIYSMQALLLAPLSMMAIKNIKMVFEAANQQAQYYLFISEHFKKHHVFNREPNAILFPDAEFLEHLYDIALDEYQQGNIELTMNLLDLVFKQNRLVAWDKCNARNDCLTNLSDPQYLAERITMAGQKNLYLLAVCYYEAFVLLNTNESFLWPIYKDLTCLLQRTTSKSDEIIKRLAERALSRNGQFNLAKIYYTHLQIRDLEAKYAVIACDIKLGNQAQVKEGLVLLMKAKSPNQEDIGKRIDNFLRMADKSEKDTPDEHEFSKLIGNWAFNQTWYTLAIHFYGYATHIKYDFPSAYFNMAQCYRALNDWLPAKAFYAMTMALDPLYLKAYLGLMECLFRQEGSLLVAYWKKPELQSNPLKEDLQKAIIQASYNREAWAVYLVKKLDLHSNSLPISLKPLVEPVIQAAQPVVELVKQIPPMAQPVIEQPLISVPKIAKSRKKKKTTKKNDWQELFHHCRDVPTFAALIKKLEKSPFIPQDVPAFVAACIISHQETDQVFMVEIVENSGLREVMEAVQNQIALLTVVQEEVAVIPTQEIPVQIPVEIPSEIKEPSVKNHYKPGSKDDNFLSSISHSVYRQRSISITCQAEVVYPVSQFAAKYREGNKAFEAKDFQKSLSCYLEAEKLMGLPIILHQKIISCALKLAGDTEPEMKKYLSLALHYLQKIKGKRASHDQTILSFLEYFTLRKHFESAYIFMEQGGERLQKLVETMANQHNWANILQVGFRQYVKKQGQMAQMVVNLDIKPPLPLADEYLVGEHYDYGFGVAADFEKAFTYYEIAARKNDVTALMRLAFCYQHGGLGLQPNLHKALHYYRRAASLNCGEAWLALGHFYAEGNCVEQDLDIAAQCFQSAAHLQNFPGQYEWGMYLSYAPLASHNSFLGQFCIEAAACQGFEPAIRWLACDAEYFKYRIEVLIESGKYQSAFMHCHVVLQWEKEWKEGKAILAHCQDMLDLRKDDVGAQVTIPEVLFAPSQEIAGKNLVQLSLFRRKETAQVIPCVMVHNATLSANIEQGLPSTSALKKIYRELMNTVLEQLDDQSFAYTYDIANSPEKMVHTLLIYDAVALRSMIDFLGQKGVNLQYIVDSSLTLSK